MREAFARLESLVPELRALREEVERQAASHGGSVPPGRAFGVTRRCMALVGPRARGGSDLTRSRTAIGVTVYFLHIHGGDRRYGSEDMAFADAPSAVSGTIGPGSSGPR